MPVLLQFLGRKRCWLELTAPLKVFGQLASALYITMDGKRFQEMCFQLTCCSLLDFSCLG